MTGHNTALIGAALALGSAALFGTIGIFAKLLFTYQITPIGQLWVRSIFAVIVLGSALAVFRPVDLRIRRRDVPYFVALGVFGVGVCSWLIFVTLALTGVAVATVLLYTAPAFVTVLGAILLRESIVRPKVIGLGATMVGLAFVVGLLDAGEIAVGPLALLTGLGAGLTYASYALMSKGAIGRYSSWTIVFYGYLFAAVFLTALLVLSGTTIPIYTAESLALQVGMSAAELIAFCLFVAALGFIEASRTSILATAEPVFAALLAWGFLGETLTMWQMLGAVLVLGGAIVAQRPGRVAGTEVAGTLASKAAGAD